MTTMVVISIMIIWITLMIAPKFFSRFFLCEYVNSMLSGPSAWGSTHKTVFAHLQRQEGCFVAGFWWRGCGMDFVRIHLASWPSCVPSRWLAVALWRASPAFFPPSWKIRRLLSKTPATVDGNHTWPRDLQRWMARRWQDKRWQS